MGNIHFLRSIPLAVFLGLGCSALQVASILALAPRANARPPMQNAIGAVASMTVPLKVRRSMDGRVDLVVTGLGSNLKVRSQNLSPSIWNARLEGSSSLKLLSPQELSFPEFGLRAIRLSQVTESEFDLAVQTGGGLTLTQPSISANGQELIVSFSGLSGGVDSSTSAFLDLRSPGRIAQPRFVPPLQSRATAPPLGDIAVGTMLVNPRNLINISGPPVSLVLNNASAKDALMSLARIGGLSFIYVNHEAVDEKDSKNTDRGHSNLVSLVFKNEPYGRAINSILLSSGLQGRLDGRTLLVGKELQNSSFAPQMSKVFRLNQVPITTAANYLSSLGAMMSKVIQKEVTTGQPASAGTSELSTQVSQTTSIESEIETLEASDGPLLGLVGTTDDRLRTVTLVGEPRLIALAENYLKQIDLRKRQVAVKVKIINVVLDNDKTLDSSFSSRMGDTFIVSKSGKAHINFGKNKPGGSQQGSGDYDGTGYLEPGVYDQPDGFVLRKDFVEPLVQEQKKIGRGHQDISFVPKFDANGQEKLIPSVDPRLDGTLVQQYDRKGRPIYVKDRQRYKQPDNTFYSYLEAQIESGSAKVLAEPTLLISESEKSGVTVGLEVVTKIKPDCETEKEDAGLKLFVDVPRIDDNGFVTMTVNPALNSPVLAGVVCGFEFYNIDKREMAAENIRLRDGQTLIISGVISESQKEVISKWPLLGDLPLLGSLFRKTRSVREKEELVIVVTPQILDDFQGGKFGYGYRPVTKEAKQVFGFR